MDTCLDSFDRINMTLKPASSQAILASAVTCILCLVSLAVMYGWLSQSKALTGFFMGAADMKFNASLAFIFLAASIVAIQLNLLLTQKSIAFIVVGFAMATLLQTPLHVNFGIDQLFVTDHWHTDHPGRMGFICALSFILAGMLVYTHNEFPSKYKSLYDILFVSYLSLPLFALFAHVFAEDEIVQSSLLKATSFHASINFIFFAFALMLVTHSKGAVGLLTRKTRHANNFRVLFLLVLVLPLTLGSILRYAIDLQWIGAGIGIAIFCLFSTLLTASALAHHTIALDHWVKQLLGQRRISYLLQQQIHELIEIADDGIILFNGELEILHANTGAETILGYSREDLKNIKLEQLIPNGASNEHYDFLKRYILNTNGPQSLALPNQVVFKNRSGENVPVSISLTKKKHLDQTLIVAIIKNMSTINQKLQSLEKKALIDPLTKTLNRSALNDLNKSLHDREPRKSDSSYCAILLDIDDFKKINDTHGHPGGDLVLVEFSKAIQSVLRDDDRLFRLGGEEFVIITANTTESDARLLGNRLLEAVRNCEIQYHGATIRVTCSIGISIMDSDSGNLDVAIDNADQAMYQAKHRGKNRVEVITSETALEELELSS